MEKSKAAKSQRKLAGKLGTVPANLSDVKHGRAHFGGNLARKAAKLLKTDPLIWVSGASEKDINDRKKAVDAYVGIIRV